MDARIVDIDQFQAIIHDLVVESISHCTIGTLLPLISHTAHRLILSDPTTLTCMNPLLRFIHHMRRLSLIIKPLFDKRTLERHKHTEPPNKLNEYRTACANLYKAVFQAQERAICVLPWCMDFKVTPRLVYFAEYYSSDHSTISALLRLTDSMSMAKKHPNIIQLSYDQRSISWSTECLQLNNLFNNIEQPGWRTQGEWRNLRISFAHQILESVINSEPLRLVLHLE